MTFKAAERIRETSTTTGTGTYTLAGAPTGYQPVSTIAANNYMPYFATDGTNWEVGIGQYLTGPDRLTRDAILASSNAGSAVNWGAGTRTIRSGMGAWLALPRSKSKSVAGGADVTLTQEEQRCDVLILTGAITADINVIVDASTWAWKSIINRTTGAFALRVKVSGQTGAEFYQGRGAPAACDGTDVIKSGDEPPPGSQIDHRGTVVPDGYLEEDGSNQLIATYPALYSKITRRSTATVTIASPGVWTWNNHKLKVNDRVKFSTTGALPTGLTAGTTYFIKNPATNTFEVAATEGGTSINTSGTQSGTHTAIHAPHGDGDGSTTFTLPDSRRRTNIGRGGSGTATIGAGLGSSGGAETHTLATSEIPSHVHTMFDQSGSSGANGNVARWVAVTIVSNATGQKDTDAAGGGGAHNNIPPALVATKLIKT